MIIDEPYRSDQIKRWIGGQRYIGDQMTDGVVTHSVTQGRVELTDGREVDAWSVMSIGKIGAYTREDGPQRSWTERSYGYTTFVKPRIDRQGKSESSDAEWPFIPQLSYGWLREHEPELFRAIFGEPKIFSEEPAANWPPFC